MPGRNLTESDIKNIVRTIIDPIIIKFRENIYGSGVTFNTYIGTHALPPGVEQVTDSHIIDVISNDGFIKGIKTYLSGVLKGSDQTELNFVGSGISVVSSGVRSTVTFPNGLANPMIARGDIIVHSGGTTASRLAVGQDGYVLTADATAPLGVKWATPSGGLSASGYISYTDATRVLKVDANYNITKDGSDFVSLWEDLGVFSIDIEQASASLQPLWVPAVINGQPVVRFDGSNDYMSTGYSAIALPRVTVMLVVQPKASETTKGIFSWAGSSTSGTPFILFQRDSTNVKIFVDGNYRWTIAHASNATKLYYLDGSGSTWRLWVNGTAQSDYTGGFSNQSTATTIYLGIGFNGSSNSDIPYLEIRNVLLSSSDRTATIDTIKSVYGL